MGIVVRTIRKDNLRLYGQREMKGKGVYPRFTGIGDALCALSHTEKIPITTGLPGVKRGELDEGLGWKTMVKKRRKTLKKKIIGLVA